MSKTEKTAEVNTSSKLDANYNDKKKHPPTFSSLSNYEEERAKTLEEIETAYKKALEIFGQNDFINAEQELIKVLRPVLSKSEMKSLYIDVEDVREETLNAMYHLGLIYLNSSYFNNHAKAAAIFQYCAAFSKEYKVSLKLNNDTLGNQEFFIRQAHLVENRLCGDRGLKLDDRLVQSLQYKKELEWFRNTIKHELETIKDWDVKQIGARSEKIKNIYNDCTNFFVNHPQTQHNGQFQGANQKPGLMQRLLEECYQQLAPVPEGCKYAIVGLGSLSLGTMNPWSDLEFAVIINEDKPSYREYFRNLTKLLWIKVINLKETPLSALGVEALNNYNTGDEKDNWFRDNITQKAFRFDPLYEDACKTPLGRQGSYRVKEKIKNKDTGIETETTIIKPDYELIFTPDQMLMFQLQQVQFPEEYRNIKNWFEADRHLVQALQTVSLIDGNQELLKEYQIKLKEFQLHHSELHKSRTIKLLNEDVSKFSLKLGDTEEGKLFDVKQTIYRLADRIVNALANYYYISARDDKPSITVWEIIDEMKDKGILSEQGAQHLTDAISIATELRIRTYSHNQGRYDNISTYEPAIEHLSEEQKHKLLKETFYIKDTSILHHFYYVMLAVQNITQELCHSATQSQIELDLKSALLFDDSNYNRGMVHARFLEYNKALEFMEIAKENKPKDWNLLNDLLFLYIKTAKVNSAVNTAHEMLDLSHRNYYDIAGCYNNLGIVYFHEGNYEKATEYYNKALKAYNIAYSHSPNHPDIARCHNNLGNTYSDNGDYEQATEHYNKALNIMSIAYVNIPNHPNIANCQGNLGIVYLRNGEYHKALEIYNKILNIYSLIHVDNPNHPDIGGCYGNLGEIYSVKGDYEKATDYCTKALDIMRITYSNSLNHSDIARCHDNLGKVYSDKGDYEKAIEHYNAALNRYNIVYVNSPNHPNIANCHRSLGIVHLRNGDYEKAIEHPHEALKRYNITYVNNPNHPDIGSCYHNLGNVHLRKGEYDPALEHLRKALGIMHKAYGNNSTHRDVADCHNSLGLLYSDQGKYDKALKHLNKAFKVYNIVYATNPNHPNIASCHNNLGKAYSGNGDYEKAIGHYDQALGIYNTVHVSNLNHPIIASCYVDKGSVCLIQGEYDTAIKCYDQAFKIYNIAYATNPNHPNIANYHINLGVAYGHQGKYDNAIEHLNKALKVYSIVYATNPNHPNIASCHNNLGKAYSDKGDYGSAIGHYDEALRIYNIAYIDNRNHPDISRVLNNQKVNRQFITEVIIQHGKQYYLEGSYQKAIEEFIKALNLPNMQNNTTLLYNLARSYHQNKDLDHAMSYYNKVLELNPSHTKTLSFIKELIELAPSSTILTKNNPAQNSDTGLTDAQLEEILDKALEISLRGENLEEF